MWFLKWDNIWERYTLKIVFIKIHITQIAVIQAIRVILGILAIRVILGLQDILLSPQER